MVEELRNIQREILPNGLTILTEKMDHIRSVSMGIWVKSGSRHEDPDVNGISHFVEHMVFKGTSNRSAEDIARQVDSIGGNMDAFTGKETICFNVKVLDEHLPVAVDILSDMVLHPVFDAKEIVRERGVILEEIKMDEDNPDYLVHEIFTQNFFKGHPLGKPILGTKETVRRFEQEAILGYYGGKFSPGKHDHFRCRQSESRGIRGSAARAFRSTAGRLQRLARHAAEDQLAHHPAQQEIAGAGADLRRRAVVSHQPRSPLRTYILNTLLGGGMSSRLFQNVREKQGLVYSIFSELNPFRDTGMLSVYAGTSRESAPKVVQSIVNEFRELKEGTHLRRRAEARQGSAEGQPDAEPGIEHGAHVEPGAAGDVLRPLLQHGRDHRPHPGGDASKTSAVGQGVVSA